MMDVIRVYESVHLNGPPVVQTKRQMWAWPTSDSLIDR